MGAIKEELAAERIEGVLNATSHNVDVSKGFTCDNCAGAPTCKLAYDAWNTRGDCLREK